MPSLADNVNDRATHTKFHNLYTELCFVPYFDCASLSQNITVSKCLEGKVHPKIFIQPLSTKQSNLIKSIWDLGLLKPFYLIPIYFSCLGELIFHQCEGKEIMTEFAFLQVVPFLKKIKCLHSVLTRMHCLYIYGLRNAFTFA